MQVDFCIEDGSDKFLQLETWVGSSIARSSAKFSAITGWAPIPKMGGTLAGRTWKDMGPKINGGITPINGGITRFNGLVNGFHWGYFTPE